MFQAPKNIDQLIFQAETEQLYIKLIEQLNKDFSLANERIDFRTDISVADLKNQLHDKIYYMIQHQFMKYLNLLYIIDVAESDIKKLNEPDLLILAEQVSFLILKREWMKVWFRNKY